MIQQAGQWFYRRCGFPLFVFPVLLLAFAAPGTAAAQAEPGEPAGFAILAKETGGSVLGGVVGGAAAGLVVFAVSRVSGAGNPALGALACYPFGCMFGTGLVGQWNDQRGRNWAALVGALVGLGAGCGVWRVVESDAGVIAPLCLAPVGAVAGYNLSRPGMWLSGRRVMPGGLGLRTEHDGNEILVTALDVRLVNVRF